MPSNHESERLLQEEKRKNLLCGGLAGEIQQVAQGIMLARETVELQTRGALPESSARFIEPALADMDVCVRYLNYIAENLTDLTSQVQGRLTPRLQPVEPAWQWEQMVSLVNESCLGGDRVRWECGCAEGQFVLADQAWADKVLLNLLMNALRYTQEPVRVSLQPEGEGMRLLVEDSGPGLPPELMEHLFEPFLADSAQDGARHGVGLGLYLAREYSLAMGWGFSLESGPAAPACGWTSPPIRSLPPGMRLCAAPPAALRCARVRRTACARLKAALPFERAFSKPQNEQGCLFSERRPSFLIVYKKRVLL